LLRNLGGGKFQDVTQAAGVQGGTNRWSTSAAFFDYDGDGDLDLFVCNYAQWSRETDLQVDYRLPEVGRAYGPPMSFAGSYPILYRNDGGRFTDVSASAGIQIKNKATGLPMAKSLGVSPIDLDNDGWIDLVVANDTVQNFVFHNNHDGTFTEIGGRSGIAYNKFGAARGAMGIDTGRFHNDDTVAISIGNFANEMTAFYVASRDPLFFSDEAIDAGIGTPSRTLLTFGVFFFDYDLDGYLDLLTANGHIEPDIQKARSNQSYAQPAQLFWNSGSGSKEGGFYLVPPSRCGPDLYQPMVGRGSAYADIDGDGDLDVLITQVNGPPRLFRNEQKLGHNWVRLKLVGRKSNRDAIGTWVKLRVGKRVMSRQVMPTRGYLSQSELPVTFGLGSATKIDETQVLWPDGTRQDNVPLKLNSLNTIAEP
ncbi:MAG TPA: CRTAC1 family protein, partial [Verrucomicrobiae bacterium]|nr:CRTAC1 family protein [Verrucomicrobiae bacterium]